MMNFIKNKAKGIFKPVKQSRLFRNVKKTISKQSSFVFNPMVAKEKLIKNKRKIESLLNESKDFFKDKKRSKSLKNIRRLLEEENNANDIFDLILNTQYHIRQALIVDLIDLPLTDDETIENNIKTEYNVLNSNNNVIGTADVFEDIFIEDMIQSVLSGQEFVPLEEGDITQAIEGIDSSCAGVAATTVSQNRKIEFLVFHYTASTRSNGNQAKNICTNTFTQGRASADFVVDDSGVYQYNPDIENRYCWAVGDSGRKVSNEQDAGRLRNICKNSNSIHIEMCSSLQKGYDHQIPNNNGWYFSDQVIQNTLSLARSLISKYGISKANCCRHYDVTGKMCPGIAGWNNGPMQEGGNNNSGIWYSFLRSI